MPSKKELIIISLKGFLYGIWSDEVRVYSKLGRLHRFPLFPKHFAGVADVEGRMASLLDLAVTIGHSPVRDKLSEQALIVGSEDAKDSKTEGFIFSGRTERVQVSIDEVFPMPELLRVDEFSECVFKDARLIPVINIGILHKRASRGDWVRPVLGASEGDEPTTVPSGEPEGPFRTFSVSGEFFAAPETLTGETLIPDASTIRALPLTTPQIKGIVFHQGAVHAIVDVAECLGLKKPNLRGGIARGDTAKELDYGVIFITEGAGLGFLADVDKGAFRPSKDAKKGKAGKKESDLRPLPEVVRTELIGDCLTGKGEPLPVLRVYGMLGPAKDHDKGLAKDSAKDTDDVGLEADEPKSKFAADFSSKEVEVVEFPIASMRYALPYMETREIIGVKPWRELPGLPSIIRGVAEYKGDPLPVVDLAACFGKRTRSGPDSRFIVMESGGKGESGRNARKTKVGVFRALVLAPSAPKRRMVLLEDQRELPITQTRDYVYGCYIEGKSARLILNVEALITDFDERALEDYFGSLGDGFGMGPLEQSPDLEGTGQEGIGQEIAVDGTDDDVTKDGEDDKIEEGGEEDRIDRGEEAGANGVSTGDGFAGDESGGASSDTPLDAEPQEAGALGKTAPDTPDTKDTPVTPDTDDIGDTQAKGADIGAVRITDAPDKDDEDDEDGEAGEPDETGMPDMDEETGEVTHKAPPGAEDAGAETAETPVEAEDETPVTEGAAPESTNGATPEPHPEPQGDTADETLPEVPDATQPETRGDVARSDKEVPESSDSDVETSHPPEDSVNAEGESKSAESGDKKDTVPVEIAEEEAVETDTGSDEPPSPGPGEAEKIKGDEGAPPPTPPTAAEAPVETISFGSGGSGTPGEEVVDTPTGGHEEGATKARPITSYHDTGNDIGNGKGNDKGPKNSALYIGLIALLAFLLFGAYLLLRPSGESGVKELAINSEAIEEETASAQSREPATGPLPGGATSDNEDGEFLSGIDPLPEKAASPVTPPEPVKETVSIVPPVAPPEALIKASVEEAGDLQVKSVRVTPLKTTDAETHTGSAPLETPDTPDIKDTSDTDGTKKTHILVEVEPERRKITVREVAEVPSDARVYIVKKGDTLWHIAGRFTGNPFNYPKIAEDSEIENADLIYPEQRIYIRVIGDNK